MIHGVNKKQTNYSFDMPLPQLDVELLFKTVYEMSHFKILHLSNAKFKKAHVPI